MDQRLCLTIAGRIDTALMRELGQGIDLSRMLAEPLYARDVLFVCEALGQADLPKLAEQFRAALNADAPANESDAEPARDDSRPSGAAWLISSVFGAFGGPETPPPAPSKGRQRGGWFARGR